MKIKILLLTIFITNALLAQPWLTQNNRSLNQLSFYDQQKMFNDYWKNKNVKDGYYIENGIRKKAYGWKQFKRWENYWETRINKKNGSFPSSLQYNKAYSQYQKDIKKTRNTTGDWISLGPDSSNGGYAGVGRISVIAFHPTKTNVFWTGSPAGGLWGTNDNGETWKVLTDQNEVLGVSAIAIPSDYESSQIIYIGTGDRDAKDNNSIGVLKSTDGGDTWNTTALVFDAADQNQVTKLLIDPSDNKILYASTFTGIYKTIDAGENWTQISSKTNIIDMEFKPDDANILYASTYNNRGDIYKINISEGTEITVYENTDVSRIELAVTAADANLVYAVMGDANNGLLGIFKSTDAGGTYNLIYDDKNLLGWSSDGNDSGGQAWYDLALIADPNNADILYCGGINTWKSENGGSDWYLVNHWYGGGGVDAVHADKHYLAYNNNYIYECNDGGLYQTNDGNNWENISNGIVNSQIYKLSVSQTEANSTIVGLQDNGTKLLYTDSNWYDAKGGDGMECLIDYSDYNIQYGSYVRGQISRTMNLWASSTDIEPYEAGEGAWVTPYIIHPTNPEILYAGYADLWKTEDRGDSWTQISEVNSTDKIRSIAIAISDPQTIYMADLTHIWKTNDNGFSWTEITDGLPNGSDITSIAVKKDDENTLWVTLGSYNSDVVYQSTNGGENWNNISTGIPNIPANTIIQDTSSTSLNLYVGTDFGVYIKNGTNDWTLFNTGLPKVVVDELDIYYDSIRTKSKLRAATYGRGLWESSLYAPDNPPIAKFSASKTNFACEGDSIQLTDLSLYNPNSWQWEISPSTGVSFINSNANVQNPLVKFTNSGTYSVKLKITNEVGSDQLSKTDYITVNVNPTVDAGEDQNKNKGDTAILNGTASGGSGTYTYNWYPAENIKTGVNSKDAVTKVLNTSRLFLLKIEDENTCKATDSVRIIINAGPLKVNPTSDKMAICKGDSCLIKANASGGKGFYTYQWKSEPIGFTSTDSNFYVSPVSDTKYIVTITDYEGNTVSDNIFIYLKKDPIVEASISDTAICMGDSIMLIGKGNADTYTWNNGVIDQTYFFPALGTTKYYLTGEKEGCISKDSILVKVNTVPVANFTMYTNNEPEIRFGNYSEKASSYYWDFGDNTFSEEENPIHRYTEAKIYYVQLKAINFCGTDIKQKGISITLPTTLVNTSLAKDINIYPNPTKGQIIVQGKNIIRVELTSVKGEKLQSVKFSNDKITLHLDSYAKGLYFVKVIGENGVFVRKIILE